MLIYKHVLYILIKYYIKLYISSTIVLSYVGYIGKHMLVNPYAYHVLVVLFRLGTYRLNEPYMIYQYISIYYI